MILATPDCPVCSHPPVMMFGGGTQAFCGNDDCGVLCWNPSLSLDENLQDVGFADLSAGGNQGEPR